MALRSVKRARMKFTFQIDANGFINSVLARFEPAVKEIVFVRRPDARLFDPAYLARFTGDYDLLGQTVSVSVKGNALVANLPGQPQFDLMPSLRRSSAWPPSIRAEAAWWNCAFSAD